MGGNMPLLRGDGRERARGRGAEEFAKKEQRRRGERTGRNDDDDDETP